KETMAFVDDMHHGRRLQPQVYPHDALYGRWLRSGQGAGDIGHPFSPLALDAEDARLAEWFAERLRAATANSALSHLPVLAHRNVAGITPDAPVLVVPLTDLLTEHRVHARLKRAFPDGASFTEGLVLNGARQGGGEVLGAGTFATIWQDVAVQDLHQHFDGAEVLLAHVLDRLSRHHWMISWLTLPAVFRK